MKSFGRPNNVFTTNPDTNSSVSSDPETSPQQVDHRQAFFQFSRTPSPYLQPFNSPTPSPAGGGRKQYFSPAGLSPQPAAAADTAVKNCRHCGYSFRASSSSKHAVDEGYCSKECRVCAQWFTIKTSSSAPTLTDDVPLRQPKPTSPRPAADAGGTGTGTGIGIGAARVPPRPTSTGNLVVLMTAAPSPPLPPVRPVAAVAAGDGGGGKRERLGSHVGQRHGRQHPAGLQHVDPKPLHEERVATGGTPAATLGCGGRGGG